MATLISDDILFSDLDASFIEHPIKKELSRKTNEAAIKTSLRNLILTNFYERPFQPLVGCGVYGLLFEPMTPLTQTAIEEAITAVINNFEKRVNLLQVRSVADIDNNLYRVTIVFSILNSENELSLPVILERVR